MAAWAGEATTVGGAVGLLLNIDVQNLRKIVTPRTFKELFRSHMPRSHSAGQPCCGKGAKLQGHLPAFGSAACLS